MTPPPRWLDSHCHLAMDALSGELDAVVRRAAEAGVYGAIVVGTNPEDWEQCAGIAGRFGFAATAGLHPHEASRWNGECRGRLDAALNNPAVRAVGEIGLDYHYDLSPRDAQRAAFEAQLELALSLKLPVAVHSRLAFEDTLALLRSAGKGLKGVIHCYTYGPEEAIPFLELGLFVSFSGIVTFPKAAEIRSAAERVPLDRLLVETDAPYLAPVPFRGRRCEPAHVAATGKFLAKLLGIVEDELAAATTKNAQRLFGPLPLASQ